MQPVHVMLADTVDERDRRGAATRPRDAGGGCVGVHHVGTGQQHEIGHDGCSDDRSRRPDAARRWSLQTALVGEREHRDCRQRGQQQQRGREVKRYDRGWQLPFYSLLAEPRLEREQY
jgi:hypothetical protein